MTPQPCRGPAEVRRCVLRVSQVQLVAYAATDGFVDVFQAGWGWRRHFLRTENEQEGRAEAVHHAQGKRHYWAHGGKRDRHGGESERGNLYDCREGFVLPARISGQVADLNKVLQPQRAQSTTLFSKSTRVVAGRTDRSPRPCNNFGNAFHRPCPG